MSNMLSPEGSKGTVKRFKENLTTLPNLETNKVSRSGVAGGMRIRKSRLIKKS